MTPAARTFGLVALALAFGAPLLAAPKAPARRGRAAASASCRPPPFDLPGPVGVARVSIDATPARALVTTDLTLPRGAWSGSDLDVYVAYGAPGVPDAVDASLCATGPNELVAPADARCEPLRDELLVHAPTWAALVVGRASMAGRGVHLGAASIEAALAPGNMATLRLRESRPLPAADDHGGRELVVRLGASRGHPFVLGTVEITAGAGRAPRRAEARLCGPNIDETRVAVVGLAPEGATPAPLAPRATTDDLCVRFWLD